MLAAIERYLPDVVITFGPGGITRHPDHLAVSQATTAAVHQARSRGVRSSSCTTTRSARSAPSSSDRRAPRRPAEHLDRRQRYRRCQARRAPLPCAPHQGRPAAPRTTGARSRNHRHPLPRLARRPAGIAADRIDDRRCGLGSLGQFRTLVRYCRSRRDAEPQRSISPVFPRA